MIDRYLRIFKKNWYSLRFRLVFVSLLVELIMLSILVWNSTRLTSENLIYQAQHRLDEVLPILNTALSPPLLSHDTATLQEVTKKLIRDEGIYYAAVYNSFNEQLIEEGTSKTSQFSPWKRDLTAHIENLGTSTPYRIKVPIQMNDYSLGYLVLELDTGFIHTISNNTRNQGLFIASIEILLSIILLTILGLALTRKLTTLSNAAEQMAKGNLAIRTNIPGHDEVSSMASAFNEMAESISFKNGELQAKQDQLTALLDTMTFGVVFADKNDNVEYHNQAFRDIWKLPDSFELTNKTLDTLPLATTTKVTHTLVSENSNSGDTRTELYLDNGKIILQSKQLLSSDNNRDNSGANLWLFEDITDQRKSEEQLVFLAEHDVLTGLHNRYYFTTMLSQMVKVVHAEDQQLYVFFFDLDEFKAINDGYGHEQGDLVLKNVSHIIKSIIKDDDIFCRLGGDEFAILSMMKTQEEACQFADRVIKTISSSSFQYQGETTRITSSLGISCYPKSAEKPEELLSQADIAMYHAKRTGKNNYAFYQAAHTSKSTTVKHLSWNKRIDEALNNDLFELHFQGIYEIPSKALAHLECLIRLKDSNDDGKLIYPDQFIPFAEKSGQILQIDRWVIRQAIKRLANNINTPPLAVNISGRSFDEPGLPQYIKEQIELVNIHPSRLLIELTETEAVSDIQDARNFIEGLHEIGCPVCLDDFGSGFASFGYLKHLKAEILKIDGIFIKDLDKSYENRLFVESMQHVSRGMNKRTVAEFVENEEIFNQLKILGVDYAQGYYLDRPTKNHPAMELPKINTEIA